MRSIVCLILSHFIIAFSFSQSFMMPLGGNGFASLKNAKVELMNGDVFENVKFKSMMAINGEVRSFSMKTKEGEKKKYKAQEVKYIKVDLGKFLSTMNAAYSPNLLEALHKDYKSDKIDHALYERVEVKIGKYSLLQLLNPGFDEIIKVYLDPDANKTSGGLAGKMMAGNQDRSYFVTKGEKAFKLKKGKYKKAFQSLFGDNEEMMQMVESKEIDVDFVDLPVHIALYTELKHSSS